MKFALLSLPSMIITLMLSNASGQALADTYTPTAASINANTQIVDRSAPVNEISYPASEPLAATSSLDTLIDPITHKSVANSYPYER